MVWEEEPKIKVLKINFALSNHSLQIPQEQYIKMQIKFY
jgi:hypothetical protein